MLNFLMLTTLLLTGADHWTTYLCLQQPVAGWVVTEANPVANLLFEWAGLRLGLAIDTMMTLAAVAFLATTKIFDRQVKLLILSTLSISTGYAVINNFGAITNMGLAPWLGATS